MRVLGAWFENSIVNIGDFETKARRVHDSYTLGFFRRTADTSPGMRAPTFRTYYNAWADRLIATIYTHLALHDDEIGEFGMTSV